MQRWRWALWALPLWGEVWFSDLDLTAFDRLLFRAEADSPGFGPYRTLFAAELADGRLEQLTFFPERASLVGRAPCRWRTASGCSAQTLPWPTRRPWPARPVS